MLYDDALITCEFCTDCMHCAVLGSNELWVLLLQNMPLLHAMPCRPLVRAILACES
jgi:hypothetical protein